LSFQEKKLSFGGKSISFFIQGDFFKNFLVKKNLQYIGQVLGKNLAEFFS